MCVIPVRDECTGKGFASIALSLTIRCAVYRVDRVALCTSKDEYAADAAMARCIDWWLAVSAADMAGR